MELISSRLAGPLRGLPPLAAATAVMYGSGSALLVVGLLTWEPGKNPRWVIGTLAAISVVFLVWTLARGRRLTQGEALAMSGVKLFTIGCLTWTTHLMLGAFANGTVLPIAGLYAVWFLHPVAGRAVLYAGIVWWSAAILQHGDRTLVPFAASIVVQTVVATEVFARIKQRMDQVARTDPLTGTLNRRGIAEVLQRELERAHRRDRPLSVVAIDIDGLREVNNTKGHHAGDAMLASVSRHWIDGVRQHDAIGRTGGDEFLLVLPGTSLEQAKTIVRRLTDESPGAWSAGVAMAKPHDSAESMLERADSRLYEAKSSRPTVWRAEAAEPA
jgi:diguanylate cyclase (GGDEF)-like protein